MFAWIQDLEVGQRRLLVALAAVLGALALVAGAVVLGDDDPREATVQTDDDGTSTTRASSTTSSIASSTTSTSSSTSTSVMGDSSTTTTRRSSGGGGVVTTRPPTTSPPATTPPATTPPADPPPSGPCNTGGGSAGQMANLFCAHRANLGLPSMSRNGALDQMAQDWAAKMAAEGRLSHRPNAEARAMVEARCDCPGWAENVAYNATVQGAWDDWLASGVHRTNIEDGHDGEYGIGAATSVVDGVQYLWFVQVFGRYG